MGAGASVSRAEVIRTAARPVSWTVAVAVLFLANVILWSDRTNFSIAAAAWERQFHWGPAVVGVLLSTFSFGYWLMQPLGGWLADRIGSRRMLAATCGGWSLFVLLTPLAPAVLWLTGLWRTLTGICEAPYIPTYTSAVARAIPEARRRGKVNAFVGSGANLGPAAGSFFGALLAKAYGAPSIFLVFGGAGLLVALVWWAYARRRADPAVATERAAASEETRLRAAEAEVPMGRLLRSRRTWGIMLPYFALPYCQFLFLAWLPIYLTRYRHMHLVTAGGATALTFLFAFAGGNFTGWASDWLAQRGWTRDGINRKVFLWVGAATYVTTILIAAQTPSASLAVAMIIVANVGLSFIAPVYWIVCTDITANQSGTLSGLMNFWGILGATVAPALSGVIAAMTHAFVVPLEVAAAVMAASAIAVALFMRVRPLAELVD